MTGIEKTLVIIKNYSIKRRLVGKIIQKFEDADLNIVDMKMVKPTREIALKHYINDKKWKVKVGEKILNKYDDKSEIKRVFKAIDPAKLGDYICKWSIDQLIKSPVVVMILEGSNAIEKIKTITGNTDPSDADLSTIRGSFSSDSVITSNNKRRALYNVVHRSTNKKEARREIKVWFSN